MKLISTLMLVVATGLAAGPAMAKKDGYPKGHGWHAIAEDFRELNAQVEGVNENVQMAKDQLSDIQGTLAGPLDVNIANQPVQVENGPRGPLGVVIEGGELARQSHHNQPIEQHIQMQSTGALPVESNAILNTRQLLSTGGGAEFDLAEGECIVITEAEIAYRNPVDASPTVPFQLGLTDEDRSTLTPVRTLHAFPQGGGAGGVLNVTFPSGIVMRPSSASPQLTKVGLRTFRARVMHFAVSGYLIDCE